MSGQRAFAAALLDADAPPPPGLSAWNGSDPARRFAVYRNNVVVSLIDALAATFPVTQALVGEDFFRAAARIFAQAHPPRSRVMAQYGEGFAAFLDRFEPAASVPYLADVARLEFARLSAYHAADADALGADAFATLAGDGLARARMRLHPSLRILRARFAAFSIWAAHQGALDLGEVDPSQPEDALIVRPRLEVETRRLAPGEANFLQALEAGAALADAAAVAFAEAPGFDLTAALGLLIASGAVASINAQGDQP